LQLCYPGLKQPWALRRNRFAVTKKALGFETKPLCGNKESPGL
jgi:hypothetical protein